MKWPLNDNQFTLLDRLKISKFFLNYKNRWTQGDIVKKFEIEMAKFSDSKYSVFVSSGSTANTLVAMYVKDFIYNSSKNIVVLPSVTWQTSCSPWLREGFVPKFIDISLDDFSMDLSKLELYLNENASKVAAVFITSLLGFSPNINKILELQHKFPSVKFALDNCESTLSKYKKLGAPKNLSHFFTSTTSTYFGHQIQSIEGGFIFTSNKEEYQYYLKARNHGMVRALLGYEDILEDPNKELFNSKRNELVDGRFDFALLGNNFRNTDVNAYIGLLDLKRAKTYTEHRIKIYNYFKLKINDSLFVLPSSSKDTEPCPFSIPIILDDKVIENAPKIKKEIEAWCAANDIETRPIISGNILRQTAYKKYDDIHNFPKAELLHSNGFYIGLHLGIDEKKIDKLVEFINNLVINNTKQNDF